MIFPLIQALKWLDGIIVAPRCLLCYQPLAPRTVLCARCLEGLPWQHQTCSRCGGGLPVVEPHEYCGYCLASPPPFHKVVSAFHYQPPIDSWMIGMKFHAHLHFCRLFSDALLKQLQIEYEEDDWPDAIIPVPLHRWRLLTRGYNQALELAKPIARNLKIPLLMHSVERQRATQAQSKLPGKLRRRNVKHAFRVLQPLPAHIAIVDDILTTGHTVSALTEILLKQGAQRVDVWCCARVDSLGLLP